MVPKTEGQECLGLSQLSALPLAKALVTFLKTMNEWMMNEWMNKMKWMNELKWSKVFWRWNYLYSLVIKLYIDRMWYESQSKVFHCHIGLIWDCGDWEVATITAWINMSLEPHPKGSSAIWKACMPEFKRWFMFFWGGKDVMSSALKKVCSQRTIPRYMLFPIPPLVNVAEKVAMS